MNMTSMRLVTFATILTCSLLPGVTASPLPASWFDGKAELDGYDLVQPRYGELRHGRMILIYVTEPFSRANLVKVDRYDPRSKDQVNILKLNAIKKFQTGIYDYSAMTSVFTDPGAIRRPLKISFSMQEWCGHVYEEIVTRDKKAEVATRSYFEGETNRRMVPLSGDILFEDSLPLLLRDLSHQRLALSDWKGPMLPSAFFRRTRHRKPDSYASFLHVAKQSEEMKVPAGTFVVRSISYKRQDKVSCTYAIEEPYPHRIVSYECEDGEQAVLTGTERLPYWRTHGEGDEKFLKKLGLDPPDYAP